MELSALPPSWGAPAQPSYPITSFLLIGIKPLMYLITKTDRPGHNFSFLVFFFLQVYLPGTGNLHYLRATGDVKDKGRKTTQQIPGLCRISGNVNFLGVAFCWERGVLGRWGRAAGACRRAQAGQSPCSLLLSETQRAELPLPSPPHVPCAAV